MMQSPPFGPEAAGSAALTVTAMLVMVQTDLRSCQNTYQNFKRDPQIHLHPAHLQYRLEDLGRVKMGRTDLVTNYPATPRSARSSTPTGTITWTS